MRVKGVRPFEDDGLELVACEICRDEEAEWEIPLDPPMRLCDECLTQAATEVVAGMAELGMALN